MQRIASFSSLLGQKSDKSLKSRQNATMITFDDDNVDKDNNDDNDNDYKESSR